MTFRWIKEFLVITALAFLCNCATTNPDSSDDPSARLDLPLDEESKDLDLLSAERDELEGGQSTSAKDTVGDQSLAIETTPPADNPSGGSEQASSDLAKGKDSSSLGTASPDDGESGLVNPIPGEKPNENDPTQVGVVESESFGSFPGAESSSDPGKTLGTEFSDVPLGEPLGNIDQKSAPLTPVFHNDNPGNFQPDSGSPGFSEPNDFTLPENPKTPDESAVTTDSTESSVTDELPDASRLGVSSQGKPSLSVPESPERGLAGRNAKDQDTLPAPNTLSSSLEVANSSGEVPQRSGRRNSRSHVPEDFASDDLGVSLGESFSLAFTSSSNGGETISEKNQPPYLHLSQWLPRGSLEGSTDGDVYLGRSDPETERGLETYIDESPLVGLNPHVPWEYDAIAELLQSRVGETADTSHSRRYGYETVRKLLARDNSFSPDESVLEAPTPPMDYENVLRWLKRRRDEAGANRSKLSAKRKYSKALQWIRNEGRRD